MAPRQISGGNCQYGHTIALGEKCLVCMICINFDFWSLYLSYKLWTGMMGSWSSTCKRGLEVAVASCQLCPNTTLVLLRRHVHQLDLEYAAITKLHLCSSCPVPTLLPRGSLQSRLPGSVVIWERVTLFTRAQDGRFRFRFWGRWASSGSQTGLIV